MVRSEPDLFFRGINHDAVVLQVRKPENQIIRVQIRHMHGRVSINVVTNLQGWVNRFGNTLFATTVIAVDVLRSYEVDREYA